VIRAGGVDGDRLRCCVGHDQAVVVAEIASRTVESTHTLVVGPTTINRSIPFARRIRPDGAVEAAIARLVQHDITLVRRQLRDDVGVPAVADEDA